MRKIIAVVGDADIEKDGDKYKLAHAMGRAIIDNGYRLQTGGKKGVMEAACIGARSSAKYREGDILAIIPSFNIADVNPYVDIVIPTGIDVIRNTIVAQASCVVAIGGGAGTLSEIAYSWTLKKLVIAFKNVRGWSDKVADTRMDDRIRYSGIKDDRVYGVVNANEAIDIINNKIALYNDYHRGI